MPSARASTYGPFGAVGKLCPNSMSIVRFRAVDGADREPDQENQYHNDIEDHCNVVHPANEFGTSCCNGALYAQEQKHDQVDMPILWVVVRIGNLSSRDYHGCQGVVQRARACYEATCNSKRVASAHVSKKGSEAGK